MASALINSFQLLKTFSEKVEVEHFLYFHAFAFPVMTFMRFLYPDLLRLFNYNEYVDFYQGIALRFQVANIFIGIGIVTSSSFMCILRRSIKYRSLKHLKTYILNYFIVIVLTNMLAVLKYHIKLEDPSSRFLYTVTLIYQLQFVMDASSLLYFLEKLRLENDLPPTITVFWIRLENIMYFHVFVVISLGLLQIINYTYILMVYPNFFSIAVGLICVQSVSVLNSVGLLHGIRKKDPNWIAVYRIVKLSLIIFLTLSSPVTLDVKVIVNFREDLSILTSAFAVIRNLYYITELLLLHLYSNLFRSQSDDMGEGSSSYHRKYQIELRFKMFDRFLNTKEIPRIRVNLEPEANGYLGKGQFGKVFKGRLTGKDRGTLVAVKFINWDVCSHSDNLMSQISEIRTLQRVMGGHVNVVQFYGVTLSRSQQGVETGIGMEYCSQGSLQDVLRQKRKGFEMPDVVGIKDLNNLDLWSLQIASAMEYLASINIIHGDLSARNILLDENDCAKVADFGMSLRLYDYQLYMRSKQTGFPWRWMAPESLTDLKFSTKSDVWSYGILLWELYTFGGIPWAGLVWTSDFVESLKSGNRLIKPTFATDMMYQDIILRCWTIEESDRLGFLDIINSLRTRRYTRNILDISRRLETQNSLSV